MPTQQHANRALLLFNMTTLLLFNKKTFLLLYGAPTQLLVQYHTIKTKNIAQPKTAQTPPPCPTPPHPHLEIFQNLNNVPALPQRRLTRVRPPHKLLRLTKTFVPPRQRRIHDVLAIATHHNKPPVGVMHQRLRVHVRAAQVFYGQWEALAIADFVVVAQGLEGYGLDFVVAGPDDFSGGIHGYDGLFASEAE